MLVTSPRAGRGTTVAARCQHMEVDVWVVSLYCCVGHFTPCWQGDHCGCKVVVVVVGSLWDAVGRVVKV